MIWGLLFLFLLLLAALVYAFGPFRQAARPYPLNPRPEELRAELELLKVQARDADGNERKRLLAQMVRLERELGPAPAAPGAPSKMPLWAPVVALVALVGLGVSLYAYTLPRLPGETTVTARREAQELRDLEQKAAQTGAVADQLAFAAKAYELGDFERAGQGYLQVIEKDPRNTEAVRRLGILLFMSGRPEEAIQVLEISTATDPQNPEGWLFLGNALFGQQQPEAAIRAWNKYLEVGGDAQDRVKSLIATAQAQLVEGPPGQSVYLARCAACHGAQAQGGTGPRLAGNPVSKIPEAVREIVTRGRGAMPAQTLSEDELNQLLTYLGGL